jgi:hypothetical protein
MASNSRGKVGIGHNMQSAKVVNDEWTISAAGVYSMLGLG